MSDETYYRIVTTWNNNYVIEYSYNKVNWQRCTWSYYGGLLGPIEIPYEYITMFFAKRKLRSFVKRDATLLSKQQRKESFVPKVVYGPYP